MSLKVVSFDAKAERKQEVVDKAKHLLSLAEAGEIVDLSYAASCIDGAVKTGFTPTDDAFRRMAAVSRLLYLFHQAMDSEPDL